MLQVRRVSAKNASRVKMPLCVCLHVQLYSHFEFVVCSHFSPGWRSNQKPQPQHRDPRGTRDQEIPDPDPDPQSPTEAPEHQVQSLLKRVSGCVH